MKKYSTIILLLIIYTKLSGQDFVVSPLITIPGDNRNFSIVSSIPWEAYFTKSFICWENKLDSIYTIYLMGLDSLSDPIQVVCSDTNPNINPSIYYHYNEISSNNKIKIVWQSLRNNHWVIYSRDYKDGIFGEVELLTDTITNHITPSIDYRSSVWVQEGKLICNLYNFMPEIVDSNNCINPKMLQSALDPIILYEKGIPPNTQIKLAEYIGQAGENKAYWRITQISDSGYNINPSFGTYYNISYQTLENNKWKVIYSFGPFWHEYSNQFFKTSNVSCNAEHPIVFTHPIPANKAFAKWNKALFPDNYFVAFDSDSITNNKEIFISHKALDIYNGEWTKDSLINVSNSPGDDIKPLIAVLKHNAPNLYKLCILWEHRENNKTDIWWAVSPFYYSSSDVEEENTNQITFNLSQNFPNPFNPTTKIKYTIPTPPSSSPLIKGRNEVGFVTLKVYDILGNEVATLVNEEKSAGNYEVEFDGSKLTSGIYFYVLKAGGYRFVRKMSLIK